MDKVSKIWMDGKLVDWDDAKVHVLTQGLHYGAGVFEGIRCYKTSKGPAIFRLDEHLKRLYYSASCLGMTIPFSADQLKEATMGLIKINKLDECYVRPIAFYGYGNMGLDTSSSAVNVAIAIWPWGAYLGDKGIKVQISKYRRFHPSSVIIDAKVTGYYASSIFATIEAKKAGADEALLLDGEGFVAEGPGENICMVKYGIFYTPSLGSILPGITRGSVMVIAKDIGIEVVEKKITVEELKNADEIFFTGTAVGVCPVIKIGESKIGDGGLGKVTTKIKEMYDKIVRGENDKYKNWLTFVNE